MKNSIIDSFSDKAFIKIVKSSFTYKECATKLGYNAFGGVILLKIKERIKLLDIDISHFTNNKGKRRTFEEVFCKDSEVDNGVLRSWYKKGEYSPYICSICGQEPFWNGKPMILILDHINGYNKDNRLKNLRWVCPNCNIQLDTTNGKNHNHGKRNHYFCTECGIELDSRRSGKCLECRKNINKNRSNIIEIKQGVYMFPNAKRLVVLEELKELVKSKPFTYIGEYYGVSDNAIRKWCIKFDIPYKKRDIINIK